MPCAPLIMVVVLVTMVAFYATSFDSIALTASCYSYRKLEDGEEPAKGIQLMWCILLILLPIALLFCREFHEQSAVCQYRSGISDRHCDRDDCGQLLKRCKTVFRRIAGRKSAWRGEKRESLN